MEWGPIAAVCMVFLAVAGAGCAWLMATWVVWVFEGSAGKWPPVKTFYVTIAATVAMIATAAVDMAVNGW